MFCCPVSSYPVHCPLLSLALLGSYRSPQSACGGGTAMICIPAPLILSIAVAHLSCLSFQPLRNSHHVLPTCSSSWCECLPVQCSPVRTLTFPVCAPLVSTIVSCAFCLPCSISLINPLLFCTPVCSCHIHVLIMTMPPLHDFSNAF